ncbi:MAG: hypothetical protein J5934_06015 [Succinivibrio sp.]|nr:hypothetical protein [Succinivibrio sp.]
MANSNTLEDLLPIRSSDRNYAYQMAYVLFDYGFSDNNICYLVNLDHRTVAKIKKAYINRVGKKSSRKATKMPYEILNGVGGVFYAQMVVLYCHYHRGKIDDALDLEAMLLAWNLVTIRNRCLRNKDEKDTPVDRYDNAFADLNINNLFTLCMSLRHSIRAINDSDGCLIEYSKKRQVIYARSSMVDFDEADLLKYLGKPTSVLKIKEQLKKAEKDRGMTTDVINNSRPHRKVAPLCSQPENSSDTKNEMVPISLFKLQPLTIQAIQTELSSENDPDAFTKK